MKTNVKGIGEFEIKAKESKNVHFVSELSQVLHIPGYKIKLVSTSKIIEKRHSILHISKSGVFKLKTCEQFKIVKREDVFSAIQATQNAQSVTVKWSKNESNF